MIQSELTPGRLGAALLALASLGAAVPSGFSSRDAGGVPLCEPDNAGLILPDGFCAVLVGKDLGGVRHLVVAPNGDLFVAVRGHRGGVLALRDTNRDGKADIVKHFGPGGGTGIALDAEHLYFGADGRVVRWKWREGQLEPVGEEETVVRLPEDGDHASKALALGPGGMLYVSVGSATNSCQRRNRATRSPGFDPCDELNTRAGIWRFDANRTNQRQTDGVRVATGLRNPEAIAVQPGTGRLFAVVHGRDELSEDWGFTVQQNAELPAEELVQANEGDDFGWPYCYYDGLVGRKVLAPEYGGDGKAIGRCAGKKPPLIGFPAHWAPLALSFYSGTQFPEAYRGGAFIAFHGSWNRAPLPQDGYRIVFVPFAGASPRGDFATFASPAGGLKELRASGVAVGPDGSLYIAGEANGKIWRVMVNR